MANAPPTRIFGIEAPFYVPPRFFVDSFHSIIFPLLLSIISLYQWFSQDFWLETSDREIFCPFSAFLPWWFSVEEFEACVLATLGGDWKLRSENIGTSPPEWIMVSHFLRPIVASSVYTAPIFFAVLVLVSKAWSSSHTLDLGLLLKFQHCKVIYIMITGYSKLTG